MYVKIDGSVCKLITALNAETKQERCQFGQSLLLPNYFALLLTLMYLSIQS